MRKKLPNQQYAKQYQEKMQLGWTITTLREELGISNTQLAQQSLLTYGYLLNLQGNAEVFPSFSTINALAKAFGIKSWQLLYLSGQPPTKERIMSKYYAFIGDYNLIEAGNVSEVTEQMTYQDITTSVLVKGDLILKQISNEGTLYYPIEEIDVDMVNSPSHYAQGGVECIDAMESCSSAAEFCGYLRLCAMKYIWRLNDKGDVIENLKKAQWYLRRLEEFLDDHEADKSAC